MTRLADVLTAREFPRPELDALVLDGECYRLGEAVVAVDQPNGPQERAAALATVLPDRLIAEQHTAAWIWGAQHAPPSRHELCSDIGTRARPEASNHLRVREVVIGREDRFVVAGLEVTTPLRTAIDLARFVTDWRPEEADIVTALMRLADFDSLDCARAINRRRNLPNKVVALRRLAESDSPVHRNR